MAISFFNNNKHVYLLKSGFRSMVPSSLKSFAYSVISNSFVRPAFCDFENRLFTKIFIETCNFCNNDCSFCPISVRVNTRPKRFMSEELFQSIIGELHELQYRGMIGLYNNNEPLIDKRLPDFIKKARKACPDSIIYISTNGILLNSRLANELFESGLSFLIVCNYSDNFELIPSVKRFVDEFNPSKGDVRIFYRLKNERLTNRGGTAPNAQPLSKPMKSFCALPFYEMIVIWDGSVTLCCSDPLNKCILGNIKNASLKEIWFSKRFMDIRRSLMHKDRTCTSICKRCDVRGFKSIPKASKLSNMIRNLQRS